jgi:hypothetical protein
MSGPSKAGSIRDMDWPAIRSVVTGDFQLPYGAALLMMWFLIGWIEQKNGYWIA